MNDTRNIKIERFQTSETFVMPCLTAEYSIIGNVGEDGPVTFIYPDGTRHTHSHPGPYVERAPRGTSSVKLAIGEQYVTEPATESMDD